MLHQIKLAQIIFLKLQLGVLGEQRSEHVFMSLPFKKEGSAFYIAFWEFSSQISSV